jgi:hypothetical protein
MARKFLKSKNVEDKIKKKNYIQPLMKTVITKMSVGAMQVIASEKGIGYGGEDEGNHIPEAPERKEEEDFLNTLNEQGSTDKYSLW